ncbi:MAG: hypothetical protein ACXIUP_08170 [Microcella sp.]
MRDRPRDRRREPIMDREYEPNLEDERVVDVDDAAETKLPPPTLDPEERVEPEPDPDIALDDERPAG